MKLQKCSAAEVTSFWNGKTLHSLQFIHLNALYKNILVNYIVVDSNEHAEEKVGRTSALLDSFDCGATKAFLARNMLQWMNRSHEECADGFRRQHEDLCWTVFSAPNYCGQKGNLGAVVRFEGADLAPTVVQFEALHYSENSRFAANRKITLKGKGRFAWFVAHKKG